MTGTDSGHLTDEAPATQRNATHLFDDGLREGLTHGCGEESWLTRASERLYRYGREARLEGAGDRRECFACGTNKGERRKRKGCGV